MRDCILKNPNSIKSLLARFAKRIVSKNNLESLIEKIRMDAQADGKNFYLWDRSYYEHVESDTDEWNVNERKIRDYFPLEPTIKRILTVFREIF